MSQSQSQNAPTDFIPNPEEPGPILEAPTPESEAPSDIDTQAREAAQAAFAAALGDNAQDDAEDPSESDDLAPDDGEDAESDGIGEDQSSDVEGVGDDGDEDAAEDSDDGDEDGDEDTDPEPDEKVLQAEKELRSEREARRKAEAAIDELKDLMKVDPGAALKELGIEDAFEFADDLFNLVQGDEAPADFRHKMERRKIEHERKQLEKERQKASQGEIEQYYKSIDRAVETLDVDANPTVARLVEVYGDKEVADTLRQTAQATAMQHNRVATPEELLNNLEQRYAPLVQTAAKEPKSDSKAKPKSKPTERKRAKKRPKTLRNNAQRSRAPVKPVEEMSPEEEAAYYRERASQAFQAALAGAENR